MLLFPELKKFGGLYWKMKVQILIFWPLATHDFVDWHRHFGGTSSLFLQKWQNLLPADAEVITVMWIGLIM